MSKLTYEVQAQAVTEAFAKLTDEAAQQRVLGALGRTILTRVQLGFRTGTSPYGLPWRKLAVRNGQPLVDTGRLRSSFTMQIAGAEVIIGTNVTYAPVHQFGATIKAKNKPYLVFPIGGSAAGEKPKGYRVAKQVTIPPRPFLPISGATVQLPPAWAASALNAMTKALGL